MPSLTDYQITL